MKAIDCDSATAMDLAEAASRRGWINMRRVGSVVEVTFPRLLTAEEQELLREQD